MDSGTNTIETFRCDRQAMTLSRPGCARLWLAAQAQAPKPFESKWHCRACPIGAANAGQAAPQDTADEAAAVIALEDLCPRCYRKGNRLIGDHLCVSCYNRAREVVRGKNRKGNRPKVVEAKFIAVDVVVSEPGSSASVAPRRFSNVMSSEEAMLFAAKQAKGKPLTFSRPNAVLVAPAVAEAA
jgi:hypothetical protein